MTATWPSSLPTPFAVGHGIEPVPTSRRSQMEVGVPRQRQAQTEPLTNTPNVKLEFNQHEMAIFEAWHAHELHLGNDWFLFPWANGQGVTEIEVRMIEGKFKGRYDGKGVFTVTFDLEIRNRPLMSKAELAQYL
ncbi:hypothetical protein [Methylobacillus flagellatus]|uniref:Uncharacterized protein n=1 Tax=Methylobacillus flagellatus (strain ATCC 51484 / DSM 6875 / VKM B-1610 / KT) TaxID=265072 RepID=Q1GXT6_METFK|nr:hypothetical protein [Methylobacillus flagellatus]ABE50951.1 hypothetical protein Mfla_2688 [Methylobacillus flagellatus KT]